METVVMGKNIVHEYSVESGITYSRNEDEIETGVFTAKPRLVVKDVIESWEEICRYAGDPQLNVDCWPYNSYLYLSEDELVRVVQSIFRADLGQHRQLTDKILSERDENKQEAEEAYAYITKEFNKEMIESNPKLKSYCEVHKLIPEDTDVIALFEVVYDHNNYEIDNGSIKEIETKTVTKQSLPVMSSIDALEYSIQTLAKSIDVL